MLLLFELRQGFVVRALFRRQLLRELHRKRRVEVALLARLAGERQALAAQQRMQLLELMRQNTELTQLTKELSEHIEKLAAEIHRRTISPAQE